MRVILLNGPPHSGKDTAAMFCGELFKARHMKMTWPMDRAIQAFLGMGDDEYNAYRNKYKDEKLSTVWMKQGHTFRQVLINFSEDFAKPTFAKDILGRIALRDMRKHELVESAKLFVFSDAGFKEEALPIVEAIGAENVLLVHVVRHGYSFVGDSRSYYELPGVTLVSLYNDHEDLGIYKARVAKVIGPWVTTTAESRST